VPFDPVFWLLVYFAIGATLWALMFFPLFADDLNEWAEASPGIAIIGHAGLMLGWPYFIIRFAHGFVAGFIEGMH
jgi:hypothetical protein